MRLRPATPADFPFIRAQTLRPDHAPFVTDEDETALARYVADTTARLLIWEDTQPLGFALFCEIGNPSGRVELRRLALAETGSGAGAGFVQSLIDHAFRECAATRLWLDASGENLRAQRLYAKLGFTLEGRLRAHWYRPALGCCVDQLFYGMQRDEWAAR